MEKMSPAETSNSKQDLSTTYYNFCKYYYLDTYGFVQVTHASNYQEALKLILADKTEGLS